MNRLKQKEIENREFRVSDYKFSLIIAAEWEKIMNKLSAGEDITKEYYAFKFSFPRRFSSDDIYEEQDKLIRALNDYFVFKKLPYLAELWLHESLVGYVGVKIENLEKMKKVIMRVKTRRRHSDVEEVFSFKNNATTEEIEEFFKKWVLENIQAEWHLEIRRHIGNIILRRSPIK